ncbi:MAG: hypothetical protein KTR31_40015 [Myxococcales bacterium]|nr:hypothetical protein [Myxococcales bacterium]
MGTDRVRIPVQQGESALLATASVDAPNTIHVRSLTSPDGEEVFRSAEWNDSPYTKTNAGFIATTVTLNWPILASDIPLTEGTWTLELGVVDENTRFTASDYSLDVLFKEDADWTSGVLDVALIYTDGLDADADVMQAVQAAKEMWRDLYATAGIEIRTSEFAFDGEQLGPPAFDDEPAFIDISADTPISTINVVLSEWIEGYADVLGISGDIPGPLVPTARSAVQLGVRLAAGTDGTFDEEETRILAETMAHETAHYLGLFHPVEREGWDEYDVLEDTPECNNESQCITRLQSNLMFPFPVCPALRCVRQEELTDEQQAVLNRYTGVN